MSIFFNCSTILKGVGLYDEIAEQKTFSLIWFVDHLAIQKIFMMKRKIY